MCIVNTATLQKLHVGQKVFCKGYGEGIIKEIRDNCAFPIFVKFTNKVDAFLWCEIKTQAANNDI